MTQWPQDPRMPAEALGAQGVLLQDFILERYLDAHHIMNKVAQPPRR